MRGNNNVFYIEKIKKYSQYIEETFRKHNVTYEDFSDCVVYSSVTYSIERISRYLEKLTDKVKRQLNELFDVEKMIEVGKGVIGDFEDKLFDDVWKIASEDAPKLKNFCEKYLEEKPEEEIIEIPVYSKDSTYTIDEIKEKIIPIAKKNKLKAVYIFGSYARNEADDKSDLDIMIDREGADIKSALDLAGVYGDFDDAFNIEIDMIEIDDLIDNEDIKFAENVKKEKLCIYERISNKTKPN